jgi:hypothetical protein
MRRAAADAQTAEPPVPELPDVPAPPVPPTESPPRWFSGDAPMVPLHATAKTIVAKISHVKQPAPSLEYIITSHVRRRVDVQEIHEQEAFPEFPSAGSG